MVSLVRFTDTQLIRPVLGTATLQNVKLRTRDGIETTGRVGDTCVKTKLTHK